MMKQCYRTSNSSYSNPAPEVLQNATEAVLFEDWPGKFVKATDAQDNSSVNQYLSNWHAHLYGELFSAIETMADLPDFDALHLHEDVAERAISVLAFLKENLRVNPPKILNQDGEALSLTWSEDNIKKFLTVAESEVDLMLLSRSNFLKCEETLSDSDEIPLSKIADRLALQLKSSSAED